MAEQKAQNKELTVEQAQQLLIHENEKRRLACAKELESVLNKWGFRLEIVRNITIVPK